MPRKSDWLQRYFETVESGRNQGELHHLVSFWYNFYNDYFQKKKMDGEHSLSKSSQYKQEVFKILDNTKARLPLNDDELRKIQMEIEDITILFDEESIYKSASNIIRILIKNNEVSAKDYLRGRAMCQEDLELLSEFGHYTIEALIVHVLGMVFNGVEYNSIIRVASLVERLESSVRLQASLLKCRRCKKPFSTADVFTSGDDNKRSKLVMIYPFGSGLVQFMEERGLITLMSDLSGTVRVMKKKGSYFLPSHLYAVCNFDISLLPIKLNLPMICKPLDWASACPHGQKPINLSDLSGGYLSGPTGYIYDRYRLLSTGDINHFYIDISGEGNSENLCRVMNKLQRQSFQINSEWLKYIQKEEELFVDNGLLMPKFLASMNIKDVSILLRESHMKDLFINKLCSFNELLQTLSKKIQRSRYEQLIINLATAYDGYQFYLPAFLDFRGRIYRSGILHFHERDLARSLILFADSKYEEPCNNISLTAAAFHYKSFASIKDVTKWYDYIMPLLGIGIVENPFENILKFAVGAKRPFQFVANLVGLSTTKKKAILINSIPITQDASASAYQIMSYFLLDETLAKRTNLIPSMDGKINDVYSFILDELKVFIQAELGNNLSTIVSNNLTRKIVKAIFMPIIYGKTLMSTASDLEEHLSHFITHKESFEVASVCYKFWKIQYPGMECLIRLIRNIGWIASARDVPVFYKVPNFTTVQDYMIMEGINIWVYDRLHKKRRRVTLRVSSSKRDRRKTEISTFVNFIHQKDAHIAMSVVEEMQNMNAPIYTVHDNFITTAPYSKLVPMFYCKAIRDMGPPLSIINEFIYMNVIKPIVKRDSVGLSKDNLTNGLISKEILHSYLKENIPDNISKKMQATWDERISGILTSYENYTRSVCGDLKMTRDCWQAHEKKWENFQLLMQSWVECEYYGVHY